MSKRGLGIVGAFLVGLLVATGAMAQDWSGAYIGLGIGRSDVKGPGAIGGDGATYGIHAGYDWDFGDWVLGGELDYERVGIALTAPGGEVDAIARLKLRGGYDFGAAMAYGVVGGARLKSPLGDENGYVYGLGLAYQVNERLNVSGEFLRHGFRDLGAAGADYDADSLNLRASFRF